MPRGSNGGCGIVPMIWIDRADSSMPWSIEIEDSSNGLQRYYVTLTEAVILRER